MYTRISLLIVINLGVVRTNTDVTVHLVYRYYVYLEECFGNRVVRNPGVPWGSLGVS